MQKEGKNLTVIIAMMVAIFGTIKVYASENLPTVTINSPPTPSNNSTNVSIEPVFSADVSDPDGDLMTVSLEHQLPDSTWEIWNTTTSYNGTVDFQRTLEYNTTYTIRFKVEDDTHLVNSEEITFTTVAGGNSPPVIFNPSPANNSTGVSYPSVTLWVNISDADNDSIQATFYNASDDSMIHQTQWIGNSEGLLRIGINWTGLAPSTTYYWYVTANDGTTTTTSAIWHFTTAEEGGGGTTADNNTNPLIWIGIGIIAILLLTGAIIKGGIK
ncbi:MAG TPA: hypothetical protein ENI53_00865 [Thermoplasmatales archaeon]|nr:hypothetical protein [Thermoplasmatales archaeon]